MKKFFAVAAAMMLSVASFAQTPEKGEVSVTPMVGISYGGAFGQEYKGAGSTPDVSGNIGFTVGAELGIMANNWFKPSVGIQYINASTKFKGDGGKCDFKNDYLAIPVLANFYVADGLAIKAGVQPAFLLSSKLDSKDVKDFVNSFDFTIPVGLSYEFNNIVLDARYNIGVTNTIKDSVLEVGAGTFTKLNNGYATITIGYKFAL